MKVTISDLSHNVVKAAQAASAKALRKAGAKIRAIARNSIKISPNKSEPGRPPHSRKGKLRDAIVFNVEPDAGILTVGTNSGDVGKLGGTHEHGGTEPPKKAAPLGRRANWLLHVGGHGPILYAAGRFRFAKLTSQKQVERAVVVARDIAASNPGFAGLSDKTSEAVLSAPTERHYPPRPFMEPAFERVRPKLPDLWAGSVR